jgi:hypothetical protein
VAAGAADATKDAGCCAWEAWGNKLELRMRPTPITTPPTTRVRRTTEPVEEPDWKEDVIAGNLKSTNKERCY